MCRQVLLYVVELACVTSHYTWKAPQSTITKFNNSIALRHSRSHFHLTRHSNNSTDLRHSHPHFDDWLGDINYTADAFVRDQGIVLLGAGWLLSSQFHPAGYFLFVGRIQFLHGGCFCAWHRPWRTLSDDDATDAQQLQKRYFSVTSQLRHSLCRVVLVAMGFFLQFFSHPE